MKTVVINPKNIARKWYLVDAQDVVLGRLASKTARMLQGKAKTAYSPNQDHGDNVIIVNADLIKLTGKKPETKSYFWHSTRPGGGKTRSYKEQMEMDSSRVIVDAIHGMLPKTALGRKMIKKLHVYSDAKHPHFAQQPETISLK